MTTPAPASPAKGNEWLRLGLLAIVLIAAIAVVQFSPLKSWLQDSQRIRQILTSLGLWGYPACILAVAVLVAVGVPRLLFCAVGGMVLGFWWGLLLTQIGTLLGYYAVFLFVRWGGRQWVLHRWPRLRKFAGLIESQGLMGVVLIRQIPIHGTLCNLCLGLSHVRHWQFLLGTAVGLLTEAIPVTLVGAGVVKGSATEIAAYIGIAAAAFAVIWLVCARVLKKLRSTEAAAITEVASASQQL